jgi:hypothetical protein
MHTLDALSPGDGMHRATAHAHLGGYPALRQALVEQQPPDLLNHCVTDHHTLPALPGAAPSRLSQRRTGWVKLSFRITEVLLDLRLSQKAHSFNQYFGHNFICYCGS